MNSRAIHPDGYWIDAQEEYRWWGKEQYFTRKERGKWISTLVSGLVWGQYIEPGTPGKQVKKQYKRTNKIQRIKDALDIVEVAKDYGLEPVSRGRAHMICCPDPEHDDKNPSCALWREIQGFKCFSCGASGDVIELIRLFEVSK